MVITLIGMSGSGKSYWSNKISDEKEFQRFCCDDLIEEKLYLELNKHGFSGISDVAEWMGMPWDERFNVNEKKYLDAEIDVMNQLISQLEKNEVGGNAGKAVVIDTTGSVIYTGTTVLEGLHKHSRVVYLEADKKSEEKMLDVFLKNPKPVIWNGLFDNSDCSDNDEALKKCFPKLISTRAKMYRDFADVIIPFEKHKKTNLTTDELLLMTLSKTLK